MSLYDRLRLYVSKDTYHLVPESGGGLTGQGQGQGLSLVFDRRNGGISTSSSLQAPTAYDSAVVVYGLFGIIPLISTDYLIFITSRKRVSRVMGTDIYLALDFKVYPMDPSLSSSAISKSAGLHRPTETFLLSLVKGHLYSGPFYFSYGDYDVTSRLQIQAGNDQRPLYERADDRFFWNKYLQTRLIDLANSKQGGDLSGFILPVLFGFCEVKQATINSRDFIFAVISRRSRYRAGTRYFSRGIDSKGNVSNFNETEQFVLLDHPDSKNSTIAGEIRASYAQIRGSVPIYWAEVNNLRYKPDLVVMDLSTTVESLRLHFDSLHASYGDVYLVNLVNQKGYEKPVKEAFERALEELDSPKVHYTYFDFHHECKGLRFDRVSVLVDRLEQDLYQQGYFYHDSNTSASRPQRTQSSAVRTNCMDSLDRTNVVQSTLASWALTQQLRQAGVLGHKETLDQHEDFIYLFRNVWADNADVISKAYSGTGALKTDYTRTGKRTNEGLLQDGVNSVMRYVKNNFLDGPRQDAYDLVSGTWQPRKGESKAFVDHRPLFTRLVPYVFFAALSVVAVSIGFSRFMSKYVPRSRTIFLLSVLVEAGSGYYLVAHGVDYVAWPRLQPLTDTINYQGKGFSSGRHGRGFAAGGNHKLSQLAAQGGGEKGEKDMEMAHAHPVAGGGAVAGKKRVD
ncbi:MAG: hypothetical protein CYPHOPRED_002091 [Cyphobasidiales sp. Tagirdzhanova-0007]|nr:MAG: hypothetical protein CYPHOPRED_002091 [Cyphobasidiales sp. Tagirdzhanova-0007]